MLEGKVCSCFGQVDVEITDDIRARTKIEIDKAIEDGVKTFLFGGFSVFDELCYKLVTEKRDACPELGIKRVCCVTHLVNPNEPPSWVKKREREGIFCLAMGGDYWSGSRYDLNCAMVDKSDLVLFWIHEYDDYSPAYKTYRYALIGNKNIVNLCKEE